MRSVPVSNTAGISSLPEYLRQQVRNSPRYISNTHHTMDGIPFTFLINPDRT
ncbi:MAG: hypothetical protein QM501_00895 [Gimesia sp.]